MDETCKPRITAHCEGETIVEAKEAGSCPVWDTCLPFGGHLYSDGGCVHFEPGTPPPDGTYGTITIVDGCIVNLGPVRPPLYTEANCVDVPASCAGGGGGGSGSPCDVSTQAGNLLTCDIAGKPLAKLYTAPSLSVVFSGDGTEDSPLTASMAPGASTTRVTANPPISVTSKDNVYDISHRKGTSLKLNGMEFDSWGHLVAYNTPPDSANSPIIGILGDALSGVEAKANTPSAGIYTIGLAALSGSDSATQLGGYEVSVDKYGRVTGATRNILCPAAEFQFGEYLVTVNQYGSITDIRKADPEPDPEDDPTATTGSGFARLFPRDVSTQTYKIKPSKSTGFLLSLEGGLTSGSRVQFSIDGVPHDGVYLNGGKVVYVTEGVYAGGVEHTIEVFSTAGQAQGIPIVETGNALFTCMFVTV